MYFQSLLELLAPVATLLGTTWGIVKLAPLPTAVVLLLVVFGIVLVTARAAGGRIAHYGTVAVVLLGSAGWPGPEPVAPQAVDAPLIEPGIHRIWGADSIYGTLCCAVSPDGRWIPFAGGHQWERSSLFLLPREGGEPVQITRGQFSDDNVRWAPGGDRIYFASDRPRGPESAEFFIMTLPLDPATGKPTDLPRQVSLEPLWNGFDLSPDGEWLVYHTAGGSVSHAGPGGGLKIIPARGGPARLLVGQDELREGAAGLPRWTPDGRHVLFSIRHLDAGGGSWVETSIWRVPSTGGAPELLFRGPGQAHLGPGGRRVLWSRWSSSEEEAGQHLITTPDGTPVARFVLPEDLRTLDFVCDDASAFFLRRDVASPVVVRPVNGGPPRRLKNSRDQNNPIQWTADGEAILFASWNASSPSDRVLYLGPADGREMRQLPIPGSALPLYPLVLHPDGRHLFHVMVSEGQGTFQILDLESGTAQALAPAPMSSPTVAQRWVVRGRGGEWFRDAGRFLYFEDEDDHRVVKSVVPNGEPREMWRFRRSEMPENVAVFEDRLTWVDLPETYPPEAGDSTVLYVAEVGRERAQAVLSISGYAAGPLLSHDGRFLALNYTRGAQVDNDLAVVEIGPDGLVVGELQIFEPVTKWWWDARWTPDGRAVFVVGMAGESMTDTDVWMVPLQAGAQAVAVTQDDPNSVWGFALSPDGRHIAYPSLTMVGTSVWRLEFGEEILGGGR